MAGGIRIDWPGRRPPEPVVPGEPWRTVEVYRRQDPPVRVCAGDNADALAGLLATHRGRVDLVYLDPPFGTGRTFASGPAGRRAFADRFGGGVPGLLSMLEPRLRLVAELLAPTGSLYVHVDPTASHAVKLLLDEILGPRSFQREIVWRIGWISGFKSMHRNWIRNHDTILFYTKDPERFTFNKPYVPHRPGYRRRKGAAGAAGGVAVGDVWNAGPEELALTGAESLDSIQIKSFSREKTGYATQKNESLLARIVRASSNEGDVVLDPFCGSGTTLAVAARLGRVALGVDGSPVAVDVVRRRLLTREAAGVEVCVPSGGEDPVGQGRLDVRVEGCGGRRVRVAVRGVRDGGGRPIPWARVGGLAVGRRRRDGAFAALAWAMRPLPGGELAKVLGPFGVPIRGDRCTLEIRVHVDDGSVASRRVVLARTADGLRRVRDR